MLPIEQMTAQEYKQAFPEVVSVMCNRTACEEIHLEISFFVCRLSVILISVLSSRDPVLLIPPHGPVMIPKLTRNGVFTLMLRKRVFLLRGPAVNKLLFQSTWQIELLSRYNNPKLDIMCN